MAGLRISAIVSKREGKSLVSVMREKLIYVSQ